MFVPGVHFTLLKFKRPKLFEPLPQAPPTLNKKRKLEVEESIETEFGTGGPKYRAAKEISNSELTDLIPLEYIEVIYHRVPVFDNVTARELCLSDVFRQALRERLGNANFQPCSLFDLHTSLYLPEDCFPQVRLIKLRPV